MTVRTNTNLNDRTRRTISEFQSNLASAYWNFKGIIPSSVYKIPLLIINSVRFQSLPPFAYPGSPGSLFLGKKIASGAIKLNNPVNRVQIVRCREAGLRSLSPLAASFAASRAPRFARRSSRERDSGRTNITRRAQRRCPIAAR